MANKNLANCKQQVHHPCEKLWANNWVLRIIALINGLVALATLWISGGPWCTSRSVHFLMRPVGTPSVDQ